MAHDRGTSVLLEVSIFSIAGITYLKKYYLLLYCTAYKYNRVNKIPWVCSK